MSTIVQPITTVAAEPILPVPAGFFLLIRMTPVAEKKGRILFSESTVAEEKLAAAVGQILAMGPEAYKDPIKFPTGARCEVGDNVFIGSYVGSKLKLGDSETDYRLICDDDVKAVLPEGTVVRRFL